MVHELTRQQARRIAVRAQLLDAPRPTDLLEVVRRLWVVQVDLTAAVAPSADLVLWSRLGSAYRPDDLDDLRRRPAPRRARRHAARGRRHGAVPPPTCASGRAGRRCATWQEDTADWVEANSACRDDILDRLRAEGPLPARELPDTCVVPWRSSGWNSGKNVLMLLNCMEARGEVACPRARAASGSGTSPSGSCPTTSRCPCEEARRRARPPPARLARHRPRPRHRDARRRAGGRRGCRGAGASSRACAASGASTRSSSHGSASRSGAAPRCCRRSTGWCSTASGWPSSSSSTTSSRCTSRPPPGAGATGRCRCSTATAWSASSTPRPTPTAGVLHVDALHEDAPLPASVRAAVEREIRSLAALLELEVDDARAG